MFSSPAVHMESSEFPDTQPQGQPTAGMESSPHEGGLHYEWLSVWLKCVTGWVQGKMRSLPCDLKGLLTTLQRRETQRASAKPEWQVDAKAKPELSQAVAIEQQKLTFPHQL